MKAHAPDGVTRERIHREIKLFSKVNGFAPSVREIAATVGVALSTAQIHLDKLEAEGRLLRNKNGPRTMRAI